jgi:phage/plasmid-like protein (TIGR03299 family)
MSHELEINADGSANMAYRASKGEPWHGLGTPIADDLTPEQMMIAAGLNWTVSKADTFAQFGDTMIPTGRQALIRDTDGKVLTEVGKGWNPVQNAEAFDFFAEFVKAGDMVMDTAGALMGGQIVWCSADVRDGFTILGGDEVKGYLLFSNPHRYGKSLDIKFVMTRTVCNNTLTVALNEKGQASVKLNHRSRFNAEKVKEILGIGHNKTQTFKEAAEFLASKRYRKETAVAFMSDVFGTSVKDGSLTRNGERAMALIESQPGAEFAPGSFWNLYNVVTYMADHELGREADTRMTSALFGANAKRKLDALDLAIKYAQAA